jgi:hypothetical protein
MNTLTIMPFVAFPHQFNDPVKLRQMLQTIDVLTRAGKLLTDENLGYKLFMDSLIKQRKPSNLPLGQQLEIIKRKAKPDQSPLTTARDLKRLFLLLGFVDRGDGDRYWLTERGSKIVAISSNSSLTVEEKKAWLEGLQQLVMRQEGNARSFHPLKAILELLSEEPIDTKLLTFAFTVSDDTDVEIEKAKILVAHASSSISSFNHQLDLYRISESNARDSVKILPALAEKLDLISRSGGIASITTYGRTLLDKYNRRSTPTTTPATPALATLTSVTTPTPVTPSVVTARRDPFFRIVTSETEVRRNWTPEDTEEGEVEYDAKDEAERQNRLRERTDAHQETLAKLLQLFQGKNWRIGTGNFDMLSEKADVALLAEVKTIKQGDISDERLRIIDGVGKLLFYEAFDVPSLLSNNQARVQKIIVFSKKPNSQEHVDFLTAHEIWVIWFNENGEVDGEATAKTTFQQLLA